MTSPAEPRPFPQPVELWSLFAVLKLYATSFILLGEHIGSVELAMGLRERSLPPIEAFDDVDPLVAERIADQEFTEEDLEALARLEADERALTEGSDAKEALGAVVQVAERLELPISAALIGGVIKNDAPLSLAEYRILKRALYTEIKGKALFFIPAERVAYFENRDILSAKARRAFPTAHTELREAGSCFAAGRYTATVLHCMRAAEVGVKSLSKALGHNPPNLEQEDWHPVLEKCESIISGLKALPKGQMKEDEQRFYSRAAAQFRYFKDGWRVQAAHTRAPFNEGEARDILRATISFYESIWKRLAES